MKKVFAIAAMAAMLIACGEKPEPTPNPNPGGNTEEPGKPEEPVFVPAITLDGNFADWAEVEGAVVLTLNEGETYTYPALKKVQLCSDERYIYIYAEYDPAQAMNLCTYLDIDADETTGRSEPCQGIELYMEGSIAEWTADEAGNPTTPKVADVAYDAGGYKFTGEDGTNGWAWESILEAGIGFVSSCVPAAVGENVAVEISLLKALCPLPLGNEVGICMSVSAYTWSEIGTLPQYSDEEVAADETLVGRAPCVILPL